MRGKAGWASLAWALTIGAGGTARAATVAAASCDTNDVAAAIDSAAPGDTITIPAGTCTWTGGVTIPANKGLVVQGAGSGRIVAYDDGVETPTIATGAQTFQLAGYSPGFSAASITPGETLRVFENNARDSYMQGTVTGIAGDALTLDVATTQGSGSTHRWLVSTLPSTVIVANNTTPLFAVSESTTFHTEISGIHVAAGTNTAAYVTIADTAGGRAVLIHDCWMEQSISSPDSIDVQTNRGVIWNCSFDGSTNDPSQLVYTSAFRIKNAPATSWTTPSTWGADDTTGEGNFYVETNDFHAFQSASDIDDNGRCVWRYNLMDNSSFGTHGADTSPYGQRYFEFYDNVGVFNAYSDGSTFNIANGWVGLVRGGTFVIHDNTLPVLQSQDYGSKSDVKMLVMNLQRNAGPNACWGAGTSNGADYPAPRQVGMGWVTGTGTDGLGNESDSITYVGDSEPAYIWANSRQPLDNIDIADYGTGSGDSCTGPTDTSANYIVEGRDYFNDGTPKPGYTPFPYPHPLAGGDGGLPGGDAGADAGGDAGPDGGTGSGSGGGCSCRTASGRAPGAPLACTFGALALALARRRRTAGNRR